MQTGSQYFENNLDENENKCTFIEIYNIYIVLHLINPASILF